MIDSTTKDSITKIKRRNKFTKNLGKEYTKSKNKITLALVKFTATDDLSYLADVFIHSDRIFKLNNFPIKEYIKWKKK